MVQVRETIVVAKWDELLPKVETFYTLQLGEIHLPYNIPVDVTIRFEILEIDGLPHGGLVQFQNC